MGDENEWKKLPTADKIQHKQWKARVEGYEEATKIFTTQVDAKSSKFSEYLGLLKKMVGDTNAIAQEKAMDAALAFVENAASAGKTAGEVCNVLVAKGLGATRPKTKEKAIDILLMYIEIEKQEIVQEELMKGMQAKQPKVVVGSIQTTREALRLFGSKVILVKPLVKDFPRLLEDRDKVVRDETKLLVVEIYRWIGNALRSQLSSLKPVQVSELEAEFENIGNVKGVPERYLRSQQAKMEAAGTMPNGAANGTVVDGGGVAAVAEVDEGMSAFDLADPVEILSKLPKDFYEKIEAKKWQERREALEAVEKLSDVIKLEAGDYGDLMRCLIRVIGKDSNVMLVTLGAKITGQIARGLVKKFSPYSLQTIKTILEKFKEKKATVVAALRDAIDASFKSSNLEAVSEDVLVALESKNPSIRTETSLFLARSFKNCTQVSLNKKMLKLYVVPLSKIIIDTVPEVREAGCEALGTAMRVVSERNIMPFLGEVEPLKMTKIKEYFEKAEVVGGGVGAPKPAAAPAPAAPAAASSRPATSSARPKTAPAKVAKKAGGPPPSGKGKGGGKQKEKGSALPTESVLSDDVVEDRATALVGAEALGQLSNVAWKERLAGMETVSKKAKEQVGSDIPCQVLVRVIARKPGLKDNNFQVLKQKLDLISWLADNGKFTTVSAEVCLNDIFDKVGDAKNGEAAKTAMTSISEACTLEFVGLQLTAFQLKNPKNQAEALNWMAQAILEFGLKVPPKELIKYIRTGFQSINPAVRTAAINLTVRLYMFMGEGLRAVLADEKPALLTQIDAEIEKVKGQRPPAPTRGLKHGAVNGAGGGGGGGADDAEEEEPPEPEDLLPRTNLSDFITEELIGLLMDKNWKMRNEGLQKVQELLGSGKPITGDLGELPVALTKLCGDSNKNLVKIALGTCETLARCLGKKHCKPHVRNIVPGIIGAMGDIKPHIRAAAVTALNSWHDQSGLPFMAEGELFSEALKKESPVLRAELLGWLSEKLYPKPPEEDGKAPPVKVLKMPPEFKECVAVLLSALEDRNGEVRKKSQDALLPFMIVMGYETLVKACNRMPSASKDKIRPVLDKTRESLPRAPPPPAPAPSAAPKAIQGGGGARPKTVAANHGGGSSAASTTASTPDGDESSSSQSSARPRTAPAGRKGQAAPAASSKKKKEEEPVGPPVTMNEAKPQRFKDEQKRKLLKWDFSGPSKEHQAQLQTMCDGNLSPELIAQMFHADFKKHIAAIESMGKQLTEDENGFEACRSQLDLILKWFALRFYDTNPSVIMRSLDFLVKMFSRLGDENYSLPEIEAFSFLPYLIMKVGDSKDNIRRDVRCVLKLVRRVYPASKLFNYIMDGTKVKIARQRQECLEELGSLIEGFGVNVCQPSPPVALKAIAQQVADRDNGVRNAALNTLVVAHVIMGEQLVKMVKSVMTDKESSMLDERIKRAGKAAAAAVAAAAASAREAKREASTERRRDEVDAPRRNEPVQQARQRIRASQEFQLDVNDEDEGERVEMPRLIPLESDLNDLYQPVDRPATRTRPQSPSMQLLRTSSDMNSAITMVASQIASSDIQTSIQALAQIDGVLQSNGKRSMLTENIDQVLMMITTQLRMACGKHLEANSENSIISVSKLLSCILATLHSIFTAGPLAREVSRERLKEVIFYLLSLMLDERVVEMSDGTQVVRSVNVMCVRILEHANKTRSLCALLILLRESVTNGPLTKKQQLLMKCLWRITRNLANCIDDYKVEAVLSECHAFLKAYPSSYWQELKQKLSTADNGCDSSSTVDNPLRTIKTVLYTFCTILGNGILKHVASVPNRWESEMEAYIHKTLRSAAAKDAMGVQGSLSVPATTRKEDSLYELEENPLTPKVKFSRIPAPKPRTRLSTQAANERLNEIFRKVGTKEMTHEGLNDLYDFKQEFPDTDTTPFLSKTSQFFQRYIAQSLKNIAVERERSAKENAEKQARVAAAGSRTGLPLTSAGISSRNETGVNQEVTPQLFLERLRAVRKNLGLDANKMQPAEAPDTAAGDIHDTTQDIQLKSSFKPSIQKEEDAENEKRSSISSSELLDLKRRLEKIKSSQK